jgi:hypothetical protein
MHKVRRCVERSVHGDAKYASVLIVLGADSTRIDAMDMCRLEIGCEHKTPTPKPRTPYLGIVAPSQKISIKRLLSVS